MILIVTSIPHVADDLKKLIGAAGYELTFKDCAADIPRFVRFARPSLVIIDCDLDDSIDLLKATRSDPYARETALVAFAVADEGWRAKAMAAGADAFVMKGELDWAELLDQIRKFVGAPPRDGEAKER